MDKIIHLSLRLKCGAHRAFELFTISPLLESWLALKAEVEAQFGGKYELFWMPDDRENNSTIGCKVTALAADQMIAFEWRSPQQYKHFANNADPLTHVVVCFISQGDVTDVHLVHSGWRSSAEWEEARQWQAEAWSVAFEALGKLVNGG